VEAVGAGTDQMRYLSLRQTDSWCGYLRFLNWDIITTSSGIKMSVMKTVLGTLCKIQRPYDLTDGDLEEIESICRQRKCMFVKLEPGWGQDESLLTNRGFIRSRFPLSPPSTMVIDLSQSEEELWQNLSKSGKYSTNRAKREGNQVKSVKHPTSEQIADFYKIAKETSRRGRFYLQPVKDLQEKGKIFKDKAYILEVCDAEKKLVSTKFFLGAGETVTFLHGGTTKIGRKGKGGYLLMWKSILYFKQQGYKWLDLEGLDDDRFPLFTKNWGGFSHFKEKFGGVILRLPPPYIKYYSPVLKFFSKYQELPL
jgi:lipid II:glycine glycyltransferase (peptidoglycan interpeptide bridge formation enzyme)